MFLVHIVYSAVVAVPWVVFVAVIVVVIVSVSVVVVVIVVGIVGDDVFVHVVVLVNCVNHSNSFVDYCYCLLNIVFVALALVLVVAYVV
eukprot:Pgem_evm1s17824